MKSDQKCFEVKLTGWQTIVASSKEEASEKFDAMLRSGFKAIDLRWKEVKVQSLDDDE